MKKLFTIDIHTHILPKDIPNFNKRFGYGEFVQLEHHKPCCAKMMMNDATYHLVKDLPKVSGFLGQTKGQPSPVSESEINKILQDIEEGVSKPKPSVTFEVGEQVRVSDGPFASFNGLIEEIDEERSRVKVSVSIFGRSTPVELEYTQVEKA